MRKSEKKLIQKKIDGALSIQEEKDFARLVEHSEKAKKLYQELTILNRSIEKDAHNITAINFTHEIMQKIRAKVEHRKERNLYAGRISWMNIKTFHMAAILVVGIFIGSLITFVATNKHDISKLEQISGTLAAPEQQSVPINQETEISSQEFNTHKLKLSTLALTTTDTLRCVIRGKHTEISKENINLLFAEGQFKATETPTDKLVYVCSGSIVFQISRKTNSDQSNSLEVHFMKNDQLIKKFNFN